MIGFFLEARAGFEPAIRVLQTRALPLGYHAISIFYKTNYIMTGKRTQAKTMMNSKKLHCKKNGMYWNKNKNRC